MKNIFDIAVIGSGMFGSAISKYLSQNGANVILIGPEEPESHKSTSVQHTFGAYYDQARIARRLGWDDVWEGFDSRSLNRFQEIEEASSVPFFNEIGSLVVMAGSIDHLSDEIMSNSDEAGIDIKRLTGTQLENTFPNLKLPALSGGTEGLYEADQAGYINPRSLVKAQTKLAMQAGAQLMRGFVTNISYCQNKKTCSLHVKAKNSESTVQANKVVIATGALTNHIGLLPKGYELALKAYSEPNLLFELDDENYNKFSDIPATVIVDPEDIGDRNKSIYFVPPVKYPDGKWYVRIGPGMQPIVEELSTLESVRSWFLDQALTPRQHSFLEETLRELLPSLSPVSKKAATSIIEKTISKYPYIGTLPEHEHIYITTGGNGHGARGSDEIGRVAAQDLLDNVWDFPIEKDFFQPVLTKSLNDEELLMKQKPPFGLC